MNSEDNISVLVRDALRLSDLRNKPYFIGFLNSEDLDLALNELKSESSDSYLVWGGYPDSERSLIGFVPPSISLEPEQFPINVVKIQFPKQYELTHRDFLGALMSLGIKRSCVGDICILPGEAYVMLKSDISDYVVSQLDKIGRVGVKLSYDDIPHLVFKNDTTLLNITVSSLRLDGIVSAVYKLSREKSSQAIRSGIVSVNHSVKLSPSCMLKEGDSVVVRGKGKCVVVELLGESKKGRKRLIIKKYR